MLPGGRYQFYVGSCASWISLARGSVFIDFKLTDQQSFAFVLQIYDDHFQSFSIVYIVLMCIAFRNHDKITDADTAKKCKILYKWRTWAVGTWLAL